VERLSLAMKFNGYGKIRVVLMPFFDPCLFCYFSIEFNIKQRYVHGTDRLSVFIANNLLVRTAREPLGRTKIFAG